MPETFPPPNYVPTESKIPGIEVFVPAPPEGVPQQEVVEFQCPQCGATTAYSAADGGLTCSHCGYYEAPKKAAVGKRADQLEFTVEAMERAAQGWGEERKEMECQNCGARTTVPVENLTFTCPFCGSNEVIQRTAPQDVLRPRYLIPFKFEAPACVELARKWLGSSWMVPSSLKNSAALAKFSGVYLPFWTFHAVTAASWKAEVGHAKTERYYQDGQWKERIVIEWRWESGQVQLPIDDLLVEGTSRLSNVLLDHIKKYNLTELTPYDPKYLAGLQAQAYDVPLEKAWDTGRQEMREKTRQACLGQASTSQVRNFSMTLDFSDESWRYVLLPVYLTTYRYEGKAYQVMVNGQTGEVTGQRPADWTRIWLVIAAILTPGLCLGLAGLVTTPIGGIGVGIGGFGFVLLVIGIVIGITIFFKAHSMDKA